MKKLLLILIIFASLFAEYEWSDPVRVSGYYWCGESAITVDNNGVLSAFWRKSIDLPKSYYGVVYFSQSFDSGLTWTPETNITPDYNEDPVWEIRAVTDSENNVHLLYAKGLENTDFIYKKYDGVNWTDNHIIDFPMTSFVRLDIDNTDRLFTIWVLGGTTYYMYCDTDSTPVSWTIPKRIHSDIDYSSKGFTFDKNNNIYAIGRNAPGDSIVSYVYQYNKNNDEWHSFEEMYDFGETNLGCAITLSDYDTLYANIFVGSSTLDKDNQLQKNTIDPIWSNPIENGSINNDPNRKMFVGKDNVVHLFEINEENDIHSLNHTFGKGTSWQTETIHSDPDYYIPWFDVKRKVFEDYDEYFVLYGKSGSFSRINFQTKRVSTGIENNGQFTIRTKLP